MAVKRLEHWATRSYHNFLLQRAKMPFAWSTNDCCTFAADAVLAITGTDIAAHFRGKYTDRPTAFKAIKEVAGGSTVADAAAYCAATFGLPELEYPLKARRGDLVLVQQGNELIAGVVHLNGRHVVVVGEEGLKKQSIKNIKRAWRV